MNLIAGGFDLCPVLCMLIAELISNASLRDRFFMIGGDLRKFFLVKSSACIDYIQTYSKFNACAVLIWSLALTFDSSSLLCKLTFCNTYALLLNKYLIFFEVLWFVMFTFHTTIVFIMLTINLYFFFKWLFILEKAWVFCFRNISFRKIEEKKVRCQFDWVQWTAV